MLAYRVLRRVLGFLVGIFFRQVEVVGGELVPGEGERPVIFAGNHPNSLLDPVLIIVSCGRIVHFAAKDVLFRTRLMRAVLRALTVNAPDWDTLRVLDAVRRLYQPPGVTLEQRTELARRFSDVYAKVKDNPEVAALYHRVEAYLDRLAAAGITDRDLRRSISP